MSRVSPAPQSSFYKAAQEEARRASISGNAQRAGNSNPTETSAFYRAALSEAKQAQNGNAVNPAGGGSNTGNSSFYRAAMNEAKAEPTGPTPGSVPSNNARGEINRDSSFYRAAKNEARQAHQPLAQQSPGSVVAAGSIPNGEQTRGAAANNIVIEESNENEECDPYCGLVTLTGYLKVKYTNWYLFVVLVVNLVDLITDIFLCTSLRGSFLVIQIIATLFGVSYLACLVFLKMHPDWATGIMFSRYFMPFMGGRRKQEAPIQENSTITTSKRVVIESMIYMQCFSEDGMTVVNALLNGKKFTSSNAFAYGLTAVFTLDTISELAYFCMMLMYAACSTGEITISDIGIMSCFIILFVACGVLWGYFITLFWQDFEASNAGTVLLILALVIIILGSLCTNIFFWKGKAGLNCCEADNLDSAWQDDNFRERSHYEELARMQAGITDD